MSKQTTTAAQHTPGPWYVDIHANIMAGGRLVAFPSVSGPQEANARLIAAAPELLEVVKAFRVAWLSNGFYETGHEVLAEKALAAIAKATGGAL